MQKLIERIGTDQHKFRVLFQMSRVLIVNSSPTSMHYRIVLQRDSKQYSSNYVRVRTNKQANIDETINIKVTMFYDSKRNTYQEKKFQIHILKKDNGNESTAATFPIYIEKHLNVDHQQVSLRDPTGNKLEMYITSEKLDGKAARESGGDSSVERSLDVRPKTFSAKYYNSEVTEPKPIYQTRISQKPLEESKKSIIDLIKFEDDDEDKQTEQHRQSTHQPQQGQLLKPPTLVIQDPQSQPVKRHKPIFSQDGQEGRSSKSPSFKDLMNFNSEKIPVRTQSGFKKRGSKPYDTCGPQSSKTSQMSAPPSSNISVQPVSVQPFHLPQQTAMASPPAAQPQFQPQPSSPPQLLHPICSSPYQQSSYVGYDLPSSITQPSCSNSPQPQSPAPPSSCPPPTSSLKQALSAIEQQLSSSMLRKSSILENMKHQQQEVIEKVKNQSQEIKQMYNRITYQYQDLQKENKDLKERNADLNKRYQRTVAEMRDVKELRDRLISDNSELLAKVELMGQANQHINQGKVQLTQEYTTIKEQLTEAHALNSKQHTQIVELEDQKQQLLAKQSQLIRKYQKTFSELGAERTQNEELKRNFELSQKNYQGVITQKQQEINLLKNQVNHLKFMMVKPDEQLQNRERQMLKQRLERLIADLRDQTEENQSIQSMLRNDIKAKSKQIQELNIHMNAQQARIQQAQNVWFTKQKSLSRALQSKDRRIAQMSKQIQQYQIQAAASAKYIQQQKVQLISKMQYLSNQLTRLKEVDQQLAKVQLLNRQLDFKLKQSLNQNVQIKIQITRLNEQVKKLKQQLEQQKQLVKDLEGQLVRTNVKLACIVEKVFTVNPKLAQELTKINPSNI